MQPDNTSDSFDGWPNQALLDLLPSPAYTKDLNGRFVTCNRAFCQAAGVDCADLIGKAPEACWPPEEAERHQHYDRLVIERQRPQRYQTTMRRPDGQILSIDISKHLLRDAAGNPSGIIGSCLDISEQKRIEQTLREQEEDLRITLDAIGDAVLTTDGEGRIRRMNPQAERLTGWSRNEAVGQAAATILHLIDPRSRERLPDPVDLILKTGTMIALPPFASLVARDGQERRITDRGAPIRDASDRVVGAVLVFRDLTEQNLLRQQLRQAHKLDAVGKLAGGVVHDINNLLCGVLGAAELMEERLTKTPELARYAHMIVEAVDQIGGLTGRFLRFSRRDEETAPQEIDLHAVLRDTTPLLERSLPRSIRLDLRLGASATRIPGDAGVIQSAILNLAINARDAMPEGGRLSIASRDRMIDENAAIDLRLPPGPALSIEIADTGAGIDPEVLPFVFEPFFTTKPPGAGTGLGLASVVRTMREHRGAVRICSTAGSGTTVELLFALDPVVRIKTPPPQLPDTRRLLLVDDEEIGRKATSAVLKDLGYTVCEAAGGEEAIGRFQDAGGAFDLVILDVIMPGMDGIACFQALRAIDPQARVMLYSGCAKLASLDACFAEGLLGFLRKPANREDWAQTIADLTRQPA